MSGGGTPHGIVANMLGYDVIASEFKPQSCYFLHFWTNILGKGINPLLSQLQIKFMKTLSGIVNKAIRPLLMSLILTE